MKKIILFNAIVFMTFTVAKAQLYSNGIQNIAGNNVGIGTSTPTGKLHIYSNQNSVVENLRLQNDGATGIGKLILYNDNPSNYATFSKYGSAYAGGYAGISSSFPYANMFAFGNNGGATLWSNAGNAGINSVSGGVSTLKFFSHYASGNIGIGGNATPAAQVHINNSGSNDTLRITNATTGNTKNDGLIIATVGNTALISNMENNTLSFGTNNSTRMSILANGSVLIGTAATPAGYKLYVQQGILTEKVKVALKTSANWADFVFADNYNLQPLSEVESFIKQHKHLPGVPSADEVVANGLDLATMDAKLLEKIEELTLHMIQLEKEVNTLKAQNNLLKSTK